MRLIDADGLMQTLAVVAKKFAKTDEQQSLMGRVFYIIEHKPTAYDVDEVAEQLKNLKTDKNETKEQIYHNLLIDVAIEIVKAGGKE